MKKKKGFTLVELLAVIVILAIILVIAVPKITDTIKNSKKASFESSAKTIASQAEKKKMEKEILEDAGSINCSDVVKLNDTDYESCSISFDGNTAKVSLIGKGKFEGLQIINGTKDSATAGEVKMPEYGKGTIFIKNLYDNEILRVTNGLKKDNTSDANIRYEGANPNNYVSFNDELWRIIGVFGDNIKLIRTVELGKLSWDSSDSSVNEGSGVNEWSQADLKDYLNTMYYGGTSVTCYGSSENSTTTCPTGSLNSTAKSMINNYTWNTGAITTTTSAGILELYNAERDSIPCKMCTSGDKCNDTVERTTTWQGYVAIPYTSDYGYASTDESCINSFSGLCKNNNWMHHGSAIYEGMWMLDPICHSARSSFAWFIGGLGNAGIGSASFAYSIFPSVYLNSNVEITGGSGTSSDPYILK